MTVLQEDDLNFIIKALDSVPIKGIQSSLKLNEVFMKLQGMLREIDNGKAGATGPDGSGPDDSDEAVVPE